MTKILIEVDDLRDAAEFDGTVGVVEHYGYGLHRYNVQGRIIEPVNDSDSSAQASGAEPFGYVFHEFKSAELWQNCYKTNTIDEENLIPVYRRPAPAEPPKLDKPAKVGNVRFREGVAWRTVIEAAQRQYEYDVTPEKEADRIKRGNEAMERFRNLLAAAPAEPVSSENEILQLAFEIGGTEGGDYTFELHELLEFVRRIQAAPPASEAQEND